MKKFVVLRISRMISMAEAEKMKYEIKEITGLPSIIINSDFGSLRVMGTNSKVTKKNNRNI